MQQKNNNQVSKECIKECNNIYIITENLLEKLLELLNYKTENQLKEITKEIEKISQPKDNLIIKTEKNQVIEYIYKINSINNNLNIKNDKITQHLIKITTTIDKLNKYPNKISPTEILKSIEELKNNFLKKKGKLTQKLKAISFFKNKEDKKIYAQIIQNTISISNHIILKLEKKIETIEKKHKTKISIDIGIPGPKIKIGTSHPISQVTKNIKTIFKNFGFNIYNGPEIEHENYNFEALNIPKGHPARNEQDSFYINNKLLLRTHTSPVQARVMEKYSPPFSIITTGRCFRKDAIDATHYPIFHQIEGFQVDSQEINFTHLKGILTIFAQKLFGQDSKIRFRPDYFPFTSPSAEFAVSCFICKSKGCNTCKKSGFIEIGGCGIINKKVLNFTGINSKEYRGYAFGLGIERITMIKYKIPDIRLFYQNNMNFLKQFK